jgi:hypothetical protein
MLTSSNLSQRNLMYIILTLFNTEYYFCAMLLEVIYTVYLSLVRHPYGTDFKFV